MELYLVSLWYIFLFICVIFFQKFTKCFTRLSIFTLFVSALLIRHGISVPFSNESNLDMAGIEVSKDILERFYMSMILMYVFILTGILLVKVFFESRIINYLLANNEGNSSEGIGYFAGINASFPFLVLLVIGFLLVLLWSPQVSFSNLLDLGSYEEYARIREGYAESVSSTLGVSYRIALTLKAAALPTIIYTLYALRLRYPSYNGLFWATLILGVGLALMTVQKAPVVYLILGVFITSLFARNMTRLNYKSKYVLIGMLAISLIVFAIMPYFFSLQYPGASYSDRLEWTAYRITGETSRALQLHFYVYPDIYPHTMGESSSLISSLFGGSESELKDPGYAIPKYFVGSRYTGTWNACFIGAAWVDFGYLGVIFESIFVGILLYLYKLWYENSVKTAPMIGTYAALTVFATFLCEGTLATSLLTNGLASAFILYKIISWQAKKNLQALPSLPGSA